MCLHMLWAWSKKKLKELEVNVQAPRDQCSQCEHRPSFLALSWRHPTHCSPQYRHLHVLDVFPGWGLKCSAMGNWNSPFPSSGLPLCQNESKCKTILMKKCFTYKFIFMQIKLIFIWKVLHKDLFCDRGKPELGMGYCLLYLLQIAHLCLQEQTLVIFELFWSDIWA